MKMSNTKEKILKCAERLFSLNGYDATSVQDICKEVGISKGAFFHYFPTKESLFLEVLDFWLSELYEKLEEKRKEEKEVFQSIIKMGEIFKDIFSQSEQKLFLFLEFLRRSTKDERIINGLRNYYRRYKEYFSSLIEEGINEGSIKKIDPDLLSRTLISFAIGTILQEIFSPDEDWEKLSLEGMKLILSSIKKEVD
ncbi:MAG: TetR family transcriptional regulator [Dictyoglomus sp. NZ13-RE01]|nr:MAG: TetR family transcriptional regulator [Dictyoglomus sp. NZ13-RE01]